MIRRQGAPLPSGLGSDAVGVVEAVGEGVSEVAVGDRVGYLIGPQGAYSDVRLMPAAVLIKLPEGISDSTAATLMMKGMTAQYLFRQVFPLKGGETIALISDAGTPAISDPGFLLTRACVENNIEVDCLPGATAFVPALVNSGLPNAGTKAVAPGNSFCSGIGK